MALTSYATLKTSVAAWLMRADLTDVIPDFISLAEADMFQRLRLRCMLTRATTTVGSDGYEELPLDFLQMYRLKLDDEDMMFSPTGLMAGFALDWAGSGQLYYCITGEQLQFAPASGANPGVLEMTYYAKPDALSDSITSNRILEASPGIYLFGSLIQSAPYLGDDPRIATWKALYDDAVKVIQDADDAAEFSCGPLVIRSASTEMTP
jgi:hypothetical protein